VVVFLAFRYVALASTLALALALGVVALLTSLILPNGWGIFFLGGGDVAFSKGISFGHDRN